MASRIQRILRWLRSIVLPFGSVERFLMRQVRRTGAELGFAVACQETLAEEIPVELKETGLIEEGS
jgi:hypothetical protein